MPTAWPAPSCFEARAAGFANVSLVAVNRSGPFWARHGFRIVDDPALNATLRKYEEEALPDGARSLNWIVRVSFNCVE